METICIVVAIVCILYALYVHLECDRMHEENAILHQSLRKLADGEANIYNRNGNVHVEEI